MVVARAVESVGGISGLEAMLTAAPFCITNAIGEAADWPINWSIDWFMDGIAVTAPVVVAASVAAVVSPTVDVLSPAINFFLLFALDFLAALGKALGKAGANCLAMKAGSKTASSGRAIFITAPNGAAHRPP